MTLIHNERVKLTATWIANASTALLTVGVATPLVAHFFDIQGAGLTGTQTLLGAAFWLLCAAGLQLAAMHTLRGLQQ